MPDPVDPTPLALDYLPTAPEAMRWPGRLALYLSAFSLAFLAISLAMYRNMLDFNNRPIQLLIAWTSIVLSAIATLATIFALTRRRRSAELTALALCAVYWCAVWFLRGY